MKRSMIYLAVLFFTLYGCEMKNYYPGENGDAGWITDNRDDHRYEIVKIGSQVWMTENLAYLPKVDSVPPRTNFADGEKIYLVPGYEGTSVAEAMKTDYYKNKGVIYSWTTLRDVCPDGWHVPTISDWENLANYISMEHDGYKKDTIPNHTERTPCWRWDGIGNHLKAKDGWEDVKDPQNLLRGIDDYGFRALPAETSHFTDCAAFWSSTYEQHDGLSHDSLSTWNNGKTVAIYKIKPNNARLITKFLENPREDYWCNHLYSVRCIKD